MTPRFTLLRLLQQFSRTAQRPARACRAIRLEALEDRTVPSTVNWIGGSGDWGTASNWLDARTGTHHIPTSSDDAIINVPGVTVTHASGTDAVRSLLGRNPFVLSGGSLSLGAASTLADSFTLSAPSGATTLRGAGDLTVTGQFTWTGGTMTGTGHTITRGGLTVNGVSPSPNGTNLDGRTLDNLGAAVWAGPNTFLAGNGAIIDNLAGATLEIRADATLSGSGVPAVFRNAGTVVKTASSGTTTVGVRFDNSGTLEVQTGTLELRGGGDSTGAFAVDPGTTLGLSGSNTVLRPASSVAGGGTVRAFTDFTGNSRVTVLGSYSVDTTTLAGGTLQFARDVALNNLTVSYGGTLTGLGVVTVTGVMNWTGGSLSGVGTTALAASGVLNLSGGTLDARTFENAGRVIWAEGGLTFYNGAVFDNLDTGTFDARVDANSLGGSDGTFNNAGFFSRSQSVNQASVTVAFNNAGSVAVLAGGLQINAGRSTGAYEVDGGATLTFNATHLLTADSAVFGDGNVTFTSGSPTVQGYFRPGGTVTINFASVNFATDVYLTTLTFSGGLLTGNGNVLVSGTLQWTAGTMSGQGITTSTGNLVISAMSFASPALDGRTLVNTGTATWTGGSGFTFTNGGVFDNLAGGVFLARGNGSFNVSGTGGGVFNNVGDFDKAGSSGTVTLIVRFNNYGTVEVETGMLELRLSAQNFGSIGVSAGSTLQLTSGTNLLADGSSVGGAGTVQFGGTTFFGGTTVLGGSWTVTNTLLTSGTVNVGVDLDLPALTVDGGTLTGTGNLTVEGTFNWTGGVLTGVGTTTLLGVANLSGNSDARELSGRTLLNAGTLTWTGAGRILVRNGAVFDNQPGAVFAIHSDSTLGVFTGGEFPGQLVNEGLLVKEASSLTTTVNVPFTNTGTLRLRTGTLTLTSVYTQQAGVTEIAGGTILNTGPGMVLLGGILSGTGTINGNLVNGGVVTPGGDGTAGILTVTGSYTQTDSGVLLIDLGGLMAGSEYDQLRVSGAVTLGGTLQVQLINAFQPFPGDTYNILTFSSRTGDFAVDLFPDLGTSRTITPTFSGTSLSLVVSQT